MSTTPIIATRATVIRKDQGLSPGRRPEASRRSEYVSSRRKREGSPSFLVTEIRYRMAASLPSWAPRTFPRTLPPCYYYYPGRPVVQPFVQLWAVTGASVWRNKVPLYLHRTHARRNPIRMPGPGDAERTPWGTDGVPRNSVLLWKWHGGKDALTKKKRWPGRVNGRDGPLVDGKLIAGTF